jgi:DeoR/GlpR family transcriptional regulator of sugar metabolism
MIHERSHRIMLLLKQQPAIGLSEMAEILAVSPQTTRRDIKTLIAEGYPVGIQGSTVALQGAVGRALEFSFSERLLNNAQAKQTIARWAASLVKDGDTILMDASTTVFYITPHLAERSNLIVLTNGIETGRCLAKNPTNTVFLVAGVLQPDGCSVTGPVYEPALRNHPIKTAFISCKGFSPAAGLSEVNEAEATLKNQMIHLAETTAALIDSSKFGQVHPAPFARANQVSHYFCDNDLAPQWAEQLQKMSIVLTRCT